jgi:hypothetical protein
MSLASCHEMGMLSSVMRALKYTEAHVSTAHPFSPAELKRLKAYRLAVQAGFYSDWR